MKMITRKLSINIKWECLVFSDAAQNCVKKGSLKQ